MATQLIFEKIPAIMQDVTAIGKNRKNPSQDYSFRGIDDMYNELHSLFAKHKVFFTSRVLSAEREERINRSGSPLVYTIMDVEFTFYAEDASSIKSVMRGEAMDSGDKASSKAASSALKYALMQLFMIPTEEEKDTEYQTHELAPRRQPLTAPDSQLNYMPTTASIAEPSSRPDSRPWLTEAQFNSMIEAVQQGKAGLVLGKMTAYKIRRDYRERLNEALSGQNAEMVNG